MIKIRREHFHIGENLKEEFFKPSNISQITFTKKLYTLFKAIDRIINQKREIIIDITLRLSKFFGLSPQLCLNFQNSYDLHKAIQKNKIVKKVA